MSSVDPFVERAWKEWGIPPYRAQKKPLLRRLLVLARTFANPHDAAHIVICTSVCFVSHPLLEWIF